jgi:hypothetical protein
MRIGTSFSPHRCSFLGLDPRATFAQVLQLGLGMVRISACWSDITTGGYDDLDWLLDTAQAAGQPILLTVGMKAIQWPEFYIPSAVAADPDTTGAVGHDGPLAQGLLAFVTDTVSRYRGRPAIVAWQVENEPFNRSGPNRWWIDPGLVRAEIAAVRALDARPVVVNVFSHFDLLQDFLSRPHRSLLDLQGIAPEPEVLGVIESSDVLGLDVYTHIGVDILGIELVRTASRDWAGTAGRWLQAARDQGKEAWIIECQAEPWEPTRATYADPKTLAPDDIGHMYRQLGEAGYTTILLWGCEYWFWRAARSDARWLDAVRAVAADAARIGLDKAGS